MSKFKAGDKVVPNGSCEVWENFQLSPFYIVDRDSGLGQIYLEDDDKDVRYRHESEFDLFNEGMLSEPSSTTINDLLPLIQQWGRDRGILDNSTPLGQSRKTVEEVRELVEEAAILHACDTINQGPYEKDEDYRKATLDNLADAIGDIFVTLVMVAGCAKLDINACVAQAYEEIKNRKGKMNDKGVWVKEEQV